ncbi:cupin domain-containing protein [Nocardioides sp. C4-1]|uniref:cupin domain-containing protein n=1 Tax=Nocardioides sp. C4-1 TaxID=3151851 RepID=UPI003264F15D
MRVLDVGAAPRRPVESNGSRGFTIGAIAVTAEAHLVTVRLTPGGVVGRHPAAGRQLLLVVEGDATVSGADGVECELGPGQAAVWEPGEAHTTRSAGGLLALVVEGDLDVGEPGHVVDPGDV